MKAQHLEMEAAHKEVVTESGETINPMLHVALHGLVANQVLNNEPPGTWQTVQRLAGSARTGTT